VKTLVFNGHGEVGGRTFHHGDELPPGLLAPEVVNQWLDQRKLIEYDPSERRSLYRLFASFSGCAEEEALSSAELAAYALSP
jgi:hypothetical protein